MTSPFCSQYGIVLDAGSSHTNLYVYTWPAEKENDTGVVQQVEVCKVEGKTVGQRAVGAAGRGPGEEPVVQQGKELRGVGSATNASWHVWDLL